MSGQRRDYFRDLMSDCEAVCEEFNIEPEDRAIVTAALITSDGLNGLRKALLTVGGANRFAARGDEQ